MKNFDFLYNTIICSYLLMKKLTVLQALRHFSWLVSLTPLQASTWLPRMADWLKNGCRGCFVGACPRGIPTHDSTLRSKYKKQLEKLFNLIMTCFIIFLHINYVSNIAKLKFTQKQRNVYRFQRNF